MGHYDVDYHCRHCSCHIGYWRAGDEEGPDVSHVCNSPECRAKEAEYQKKKKIRDEIMRKVNVLAEADKILNKKS